MIDFDAVRGWVFDVDDTLYLERDYVISGFTAVSRWVEAAHGICGFGAAAVARFEAGARGNIFDLALSDLGRGQDKVLVRELVDCYRMHEPSIFLADDAAKLLSSLQGKAPIAIISDGPHESQARKVEALRLCPIASPIVLTDRWGPGFGKPHERAFLEIERTFALSGRELIYIADNPMKDFQAPMALGWQTMRIRRTGGLHTNVEMTVPGKDICEKPSFEEMLTEVER